MWRMLKEYVLQGKGKLLKQFITEVSLELFLSFGFPSKEGTQAWYNESPLS